MNTPGYESLANVLQRAYGQAAHGKGAERHAVSRPFTEQPMQSISGLLGTPDGLLYQAMKKIQESKRLDKDAGVRELLGAINYLAGAVIFIEAGHLGDVGKKVADLVKESQSLADTATKLFNNPADRRKAFDRKVNPVTGLTTHWLCCCSHPDAWVPIGEACPICHGTT